MAAAVEELAGDRERREQMGRESLRLARERYDVHQVNRVVLSVMGLSDESVELDLL